MKLTLESDFGGFSVETEELETLGALLGGLVIPVLRASGYNDNTIDRFISSDECVGAYVESLEDL